MKLQNLYHQISWEIWKPITQQIWYQIRFQTLEELNEISSQ
jgi:hypothetical protein